MAVTMTTLESREAWLANRNKGIGGSEIACVIGMNPYVSNVELWEAKTGRNKRPDISDKPCVKYGSEAEKYLRELFALDFPEYEVGYVENNSWTNTDYPWAVASLDGWLTDQQGRRGVLEIKTAEILSASQREKWKDDHFPDNYYCQVLMYMAVIEADFAVLKAQIKSTYEGELRIQTKHYKIERSEVQDDLEYLMKSGAAFYKYIETDTRPALILPVL